MTPAPYHARPQQTQAPSEHSLMAMTLYRLSLRLFAGKQLWISLFIRSTNQSDLFCGWNRQEIKTGPFKSRGAGARDRHCCQTHRQWWRKKMQGISSYKIGTCEVDMREVSCRPVRSEEEMFTGAPRCSLILTFLSRSIPGKKRKGGRHVSSKVWKKWNKKRTLTPHIGSRPLKQKAFCFPTSEPQSNYTKLEKLHCTDLTAHCK